MDLDTDSQVPARHQLSVRYCTSPSSRLGVRTSLIRPVWFDVAETCLIAGSELSFSTEDSMSEVGDMSTMS